MQTSLFTLAGGAERLTALASEFYARVLADPLLLPLFADPSADHAGRMAQWLIEVTGGPRVHTAARGGFSTMVRAHAALGITEAQRARWVEHMIAACGTLGLPDAFTRSFFRYIEGSSHLAKRQSSVAS
jgi:hemoglobin